MQGRKNEDIKRNMAFCHDIIGFVDTVCEEKQIDKNEYDKVIETDDEKDSLKMVLIFTKLQQQNVGSDDINPFTTGRVLENVPRDNDTKNSPIFRAHF